MFDDMFNIFDMKCSVERMKDRAKDKVRCLVPKPFRKLQQGWGKIKELRDIVHKADDVGQDIRAWFNM